MENEKVEAKILAAARKVFLLKGMAGARMQDIADEADINKAMLHYYFRNKEKLFETIFKEASDILFPKITGIIDSGLTFPEKIKQFCCEYLDMLLQNPYLPLFVLNEVNKQPEHFRNKFWKGKEELFQKFAMQINQEIKKRKIKPVDPAQLFVHMISMCIFPFIAKPLWMMASGMNDVQFRSFMEQRKKEIPHFIMESIKK